MVIATEWDEYRGLDWPALLLTMRRPLIIDARNVLRSPLLAQIEQFGREGPSSPAETVHP